MSLLHAVADRVVAVRGDLPVAEVGVATGRLREATALLAAALDASSTPPPTPLLVAAASHLDSAAGALGRAGDELDRYLASVGFVASGLPPVPSAPVSSPWAERVDELLGFAGRPRPAVSPSLTVADVVVRSVRAASVGDRDALRQCLVSAPPVVGWALAARTAALLAGADPALVRRGAADLLPALLPGLGAELASMLVCRALRLPSPPLPSADPADLGLVGVVLVAVVVRLTGAAPESLVRGRG